VTAETLHIANAPMEEKWHKWVDVKKGYTLDNLKQRMALCLERMIAQGCSVVRTFIDVDTTVGLKCLQAMAEVRDEFAGRIEVQVVSQVLEGLSSPETREWYERALPYVDVLGALPSRDRPNQAMHLDFVFELAKRTGKPVDVHIDQNNDPDERDTELLARKVIEHGLQGRVNAVHAASLAAQPDDYIEMVAALLAEAQVSVLVCPRAMLDGVQMRHKTAPVHNSIAPVPQLLKAGVNVALGVDNMFDFFCPFADGDIFTELMFLLETCRIYDLDVLADIASVNGMKVANQCHQR